ncbi:uncharacterized protein LOC141620254 [Silene latifolia]|uniref:uncharacterized protein LOC141620254 n=1 Tax=Silene latifolia TaxID=37657 RepID=UPI003D76D605
MRVLSQKAKLQHLHLSDLNTKYFYAHIKARKIGNTIGVIEDVNGTLCHGHAQVAHAFVGYYRDLLGTYEVVTPLPAALFAHNTFTTTDHLVAPVTHLEIEAALFAIQRDKSPGIDGYSSGFFRDSWGIIGHEFTAAIMEFFTKGYMPCGANSIVIALIPKGDSPKSVTEFRPISCCTVFYKTVSKILANRMKPMLGQIVGLEKVAFIEGRDLFDNSMLAHEMAYKCNRSLISPRCILKIDIRKAFDSANPMKTSLYFGGVSAHLKAHILLSTGYVEGTFPVKYLGIPLLSSRLTQSMFNFLLDKIRRLVSHWASNLLSYAGRIQLINSVIFGLRNFWVSSVLLPKGIAKKINKLCKDFLWGIEHGQSKHVFKIWDSFCLPREEGGVDIKEVLSWNKSQMLSWLKKLITHSETIWVQWVEAYVLKGTDLWDFQLTASYSWFRSSIISCRDLLNRLSTVDALCSRGLVMVNRCVLCESSLETYSHLFFECPHSAAIWRAIAMWLKISPVTSLPQIFHWYKVYNRGQGLLKKQRRCALMCALYRVWQERNKRIFKGIQATPVTIIRKIKVLVLLRLSSL